MEDQALSLLNGLAGLAALVNSLLMWPTIKSLKDLRPRVERLEASIKPRRRAPAKRRRK